MIKKNGDQPSRWQRFKQELAWFFTPTAQKNARLEKIIEQLAYYPGMMALYKSAKADGVGLRFDETMATNIHGSYYKFFENRRREITLNPFADDLSLPSTLIHELRHYAQDKALGFKGSIGLQCPTTSLIYNRMIEADAFAFQHMCDVMLTYDLKLIRVIAENIPKNVNEKDINRHITLIKMAYEAKNPRPIEDALMKEYFLKYLKKIGSYDARGLRNYHRLMTHPFEQSIKNKGVKIAPMTFADMREAIKIENENGVRIDYLKDVSNAELTGLILGEIKPQVLQTAKLIRAFEKVAARQKIGFWQSHRKRQEIHSQIRKL